MLDDFRVFKLATELHHRCRELEVSPFLRDQLNRASASVAMNIAEGSGKQSAKDQRRYYSISLGSLREVQAVFALEKIKDPKLRSVADQIGAMLFTLCRISPAGKTRADPDVGSTPSGPCGALQEER